ncbi:QRFP-like peptide receptor [Asterias amurensis]|uniref:QRFP-like peptide receptor n=1 Tax=Asterias amurensis TaxID=7602 RepID=UPI003AB7813B
MEQASPPILIFRTIFITVDVFSTVFGNIMSVIIIHRSHGFSESTKVLMTSLCTADLGVGLTLATSIISSALDRWIFGEAWCKITAGLLAVCLSMSVISLLGVSVDRLVAIRWPLRHPALITEQRVQVICVALWAISAAFATGIVLVANEDTNIYLPVATICFMGYTQDTAFVGMEIFYTLVLCVVPLGTIVTIYTTLLHISTKHQRRLRNLNLPRDHRDESAGQEPTSSVCRVTTATTESSRDGGATSMRKTITKNRKALKMFLVVTLGFSLCWVPHFVVRLYGTSTGGGIPRWLKFVYVWLPMSNSFWNVIIYTLMNGSFRMEMLKLLRKVGCCGGQRVIPQTTEL